MAYDEYNEDQESNKEYSFMDFVAGTLLTFMAAAVCVACICGSVVAVKNTIDYVHTH